MRIIKKKSGSANDIVTEDNKNKVALINKYCSHLSKGLSPESFVEAGYKYIESAADVIDKSSVKNNFPQKEKIEKAGRNGLKKWENFALAYFKDNERFNATAWTFFMKNKFGWKDKPDDNLNPNDKEEIKIRLHFGNEE